MRLETIPYRSYEKGLPQEGNYILAQTNNENIFVYQAFNNLIADFAISNQKFGGTNYSFSRMTWIKPNFLWMMYRSGWGQKENQNRILAIEMSYDGFVELLKKGVLTSFDKSFNSESLWRESLNNSEVRIQWDPDHNPWGEKLKRRAVQIGLKGKMLEKFNNEFIKSITDVTSFVVLQRENLAYNFEKLLVMNESILNVPENLKNKFSIPPSFVSKGIQDVLDQFNET